ncbi:4-hydroxy-tetrahydrodipicolinate reductase [Hellea sp.]|nr:4-hydroxy-tetrahydrodipicolinate reductase [Hellea sp.]
MTKSLDIAVLGADGRMGGAIIRALAAEPKANLVAAVTAKDSPNLGQDAADIAGLKACGVTLTSDIQAALESCDVLIDFSQPKAAIDAALAMHDTRCHTFVTGTTGYTATEEKALLAAGNSITLLKSGNFSLGVNMLEALVELATDKLRSGWDIEILEMHHKHKVDAPSGTALMLGEAAAKGRGVSLENHQILSREGRGDARTEGQIGFAALRGGGVIGAHEVRIASELEMITLSHDAFDRSVFASGAVTAALWAASQPKGLYNMKDVLGL